MCHSVETGTNNICNLGNIIPHGRNYAVSVLSVCLMYCTSNILRMLFHKKNCWSLQTYTSVTIVLMPCCSGLIYVNGGTEQYFSPTSVLHLGLPEIFIVLYLRTGTQSSILPKLLFLVQNFTPCGYLSYIKMNDSVYKCL